jgi:uncharacterized membrane protein
LESRVKLLGHPVHPMLIVFPVGLLVTGALLDVAAFWRNAPTFATVAHIDIGIGLVTALIAMVFGWLDWLAIPEKTRAKRIGAIHGVANMLAVIMFGISWAMRRGTAITILGNELLLLEVAGLATLLVGGWLGGELVDRLAIGVDADASVNAPNSLTKSRPPRAA